MELNKKPNSEQPKNGLIDSLADNAFGGILFFLAPFLLQRTFGWSSKTSSNLFFMITVFFAFVYVYLRKRSEPRNAKLNGFILSVTGNVLVAFLFIYSDSIAKKFPKLDLLAPVTSVNLTPMVGAIFIIFTIFGLANILAMAESDSFGAGLYSCLLDIIIALFFLASGIWGLFNGSFWGGLGNAFRLLFKVGLLAVISAASIIFTFSPAAINRRTPALKSLLSLICLYCCLALLLWARKFGFPGDFIYQGWWPDV